MHANTRTEWQAPRWAQALLLASLGTLGPFSIDTYLPAFAGIARALQASPLQMQQTLSAYLFGFAFMNLFHGALSDSFGRRPVVLWGVAMFTLASAGCALSQTIGQLVFFRGLQGLSAGAGIVISRAVIRDMFPPEQAQKVMSQVTIYFGVAPAIAPVIGGWLFVHADWHSIFWFLTGVGGLLWAANYRLLPETLHADHRQAFEVRNLMQGYWQLGSSPRFLLLALASGIPFNGLFLYVLAAPAFLGEHLALGPTQFFWFFVLAILGIMLGTSLANVAANFIWPPHPAWSMFPIAVFAFGWALMVPVVTLLVLDLYPQRRGMASSLQAVIGSTANGIVAGAVTPLVMHSTRALALTSLAMMCVGLAAWMYLRRHWPETGAQRAGL